MLDEEIRLIYGAIHPRIPLYGILHETRVDGRRTQNRFAHGRGMSTISFFSNLFQHGDLRIIV